jgi:hypothetical protein
MTLDQLNTWFQAWLSECYQAKPHSALKDHASPEVAYRSDPQALRYVDSPLLADAFLHADERKVDKGDCISFMGKKYEVGILFIGRKVLVIYDPADITELTIEYEGHSPWKAYELVIGPRAGTRPPLPESMQPEKSDNHDSFVELNKNSRNAKHIKYLLYLTEACRRRGRVMYEPFYGLSRTPFVRDIPTDELYMPTLLDELLGRLMQPKGSYLLSLLAIVGRVKQQHSAVLRPRCPDVTEK